MKIGIGGSAGEVSRGPSGSGSLELSTTSPENGSGVESPTRRVIIPPCEKPPRMARPGSTLYRSSTSLMNSVSRPSDSAAASSSPASPKGNQAYPVPHRQRRVGEGVHVAAGVDLVAESGKVSHVGAESVEEDNHRVAPVRVVAVRVVAVRLGD